MSCARGWLDGMHTAYEREIPTAHTLSPTLNIHTLLHTHTHAHIYIYKSNFLRLGREGYREVMMNAMQNAAYLRKALLDTGKASHKHARLRHRLRLRSEIELGRGHCHAITAVKGAALHGRLSIEASSRFDRWTPHVVLATPTACLCCSTPIVLTPLTCKYTN
jgi:hypothetical protein